VPEESEKVESTEPVPEAPEAPKPRSPKVPPGILQRESDRAVRPGFRSPANTRSKAQKKKK
jgi:hypothetical protein